METDIKKIKEGIVLLARICPVKQMKDLPLPEPHPFIDTVVEFNWMFRGKKAEECDLTRKENYEVWINEFGERLEKYDNIYSLYNIFRDPYKLLFIKLFKEALSERDFAELLADAWVIEDNPNMDVNVPIVESLSYFKEADKNYLMQADELDYYNNLPDEIDIYRGVSKGRAKYGLSWTDDREKAEWFKNRFKNWNGGEEGYLLKARVKKENIVAYFNTRGEKELLTDVFAIKKQIEVVTE